VIFKHIKFLFRRYFFGGGSCFFFLYPIHDPFDIIFCKTVSGPKHTTRIRDPNPYNLYYKHSTRKKKYNSTHPYRGNNATDTRGRNLYKFLISSTFRLYRRNILLAGLSITAEPPTYLTFSSLNSPRPYNIPLQI